MHFLKMQKKISILGGRSPPMTPIVVFFLDFLQISFAYGIVPLKKYGVSIVVMCQTLSDSTITCNGFGHSA